MKDKLGTRMKLYEKELPPFQFSQELPVLARLDGRAFHTFTRDMKRPYDPWFRDIMKVTTRLLMQETGALLGYTQSDEITLLFYPREEHSQIYFNGKVQKMVSSLAAFASVRFNAILHDRMHAKRFEFPTFDCRVWEVPSKKKQQMCSFGANWMLYGIASLW